MAISERSYRSTIYACYIGYITQAVVNNLVPLLFVTFISSGWASISKITLLTTVNFLVQLFVDFASAYFVDRIGYRISVIAAHIFAAVGLISLAVLPYVLPDPFVGLLISVVIYAVGGGLIEVLISPIVEACPADNKAAAMSLLHSFYCWGSVAVVALSTLYLFIFGKDSWRILCLIWSLLPIANAVFFARVPINRLTESGVGMTLSELFKTKLFWIFAVLMFAAGACELAMSQWASAFAESGLKVSKAIGDLAGPCFFAILMGSARALYAKFGDKLKLSAAIVSCGVLCAICYLTASLSPSPVLSLISCGICGFSVGILWPGIFSLASASCPRGGTALFAMLALAGDLGCSGGPTLIGFASSALGDDLKAGLGFGIVFPIVLMIGILLLKRNTKNENI